jgi:hypothetical protein
MARAVEVLTAAGISCSPSRRASVWVRVKEDSRVWLSMVAGLSDREQYDLAERSVHALTDTGLHLVSIRQDEELETAERLMQGEAMFVEADAADR